MTVLDLAPLSDVLGAIWISPLAREMEAPLKRGVLLGDSKGTRHFDTCLRRGFSLDSGTLHEKYFGLAWLQS
jgi:hypothetical protein